MSSQHTNGNGDKPQLPETIPMTDVNQFAMSLIGWHTTKVAQVKHLLEIPEGTGFEVGSDVLILRGDAHKGFKLGIEMALMQLGKLPIAVEYESQDSDAPQDAQG